jgi:hypothetical protein
MYAARKEAFMTISAHPPASTNAAQTTVNAKAWKVEAVAQLYELPFNDLLYRA